MKKILFFAVPTLLFILLYSCGKKQDPSKAYSIEMVSSDDYVEVYKTNLGHIIRDTTGTAPQNEKVVITDCKGNLLAVAGRASECSEFTFVKYLYDDKGEITGFLRFPLSETYQSNFETLEGEEAFSQQFDDNSNDPESYSEQKILFDQVFTKSDNEPYFARYYFKRDSAGRIIKVFDPLLHKSITADNEWHIEYKIEEGQSFWESDINGGKIWLTFNFMPNPGKEDDDDDDIIKAKKYYGYVDARDMEDEN